MLSDARSPHTIKWVESLTENGITIHLISFTSFDEKNFKHISNLTFESLGISEQIASKEDGSFSKLSYLKHTLKIKKRVKEFRPDILHSHYVSSYGLLGTLVNFHPHITSVWGSDVYLFPRKSIIHRLIIKLILHFVDEVLSTSKIMADEIKNYTTKIVSITPFGIDTRKFHPQIVEPMFPPRTIVFGTIKTLEKIYGLENLIRAFKLCKSRAVDREIKLLIVGRGSQESYLKNLSRELAISDDVIFTGFVNYSEINKYHNLIDIGVYPSINESFGVSVLEACSCEKPVIVTNNPGFNEIVLDGITGIKVAVNDIESLSNAMVKLLFNTDLRKKLASNGRLRVMQFYDLDFSVKKMISIYNKHLA